MNSLRERALAALDGKQCYPVPADVWESGIHPTLRADMCRHYGLAPHDHEGLLRRLGACMRWGTPVYIGPKLEIVETDAPPAYPCEHVTMSIWGTLNGIETYSDEFLRPFAGDVSIRQIDAHKWPDPGWYDYQKVCWLDDFWHRETPIESWASEHADYLRFYAGWNPIFSRLMDLFGMENGLANLVLERKKVEAALSHIEEYLIGFYTRAAEAARGKADILGFGDDFAGQKSMLLSPQIWRELFLPIWKKLFAIAHKNGLKTMMHMCGAIRPILGDLIDAGLDIYQNLQSYAEGMEPVGLKKEFGSDIVLYGGIDVQQILPFSTPEKIREEVFRFADVCGRGGKYIMASTHFMLDDIPFENVVAMYEAAAEYMG